MHHRLYKSLVTGNLQLMPGVGVIDGGVVLIDSRKSYGLDPTEVAAFVSECKKSCLAFADG